MAEPRRLLFLVNEALFFTTHRMSVALAARAANIDVHVAAPFDPVFVRVIEENGFPYHPIPLERGGRSPIGELRLIAAMASVIAKVKPDLVHNVAMKPVIWGGLAARLLGVPAVVNAITGLGYLFTRDDVLIRIQRASVGLLFRFALGHRNSRAIFQNPDDLQFFLSRRLVDPNRVVMIKGTGVDLQLFAEMPEPDGEPVVMFPARILGDKGAREFVEAARLLRERGTKARFVMVGRTDPANPTDIGEATLRDWIASGWIEWWGYATEMPAILAKSHVICMPSYREGLPRGLIEAAAVGRAIVTADVPGCREIVRDGINGLLVPVRDAPATANAIQRLLDDPDMRRRMGRAGRGIAEAEYSVGKFVADTLAVYRAVLPSGALT
jgi:glycosyltransferase involved in cell wall biosynthesis